MLYEKEIKKVNGKNCGKILIFTLSTCIWCMKTKNLLKSLGVEFCYVDLDLLNSEQQEEVRSEIKKYRTDFSFPKIIINEKVISGYKEDEITQAVKESSKINSKEKKK